MIRRLTLRGLRRSPARLVPMAAFFTAACLLSSSVLATGADAALPDTGASSPVCEAPEPASDTEGDIVVLPAQRAFFDPITGRPVVPPPAARRSLELDARMLDALSTSTAGLAVERRPDGTRVLRLGGRFASPLFGTVGVAGTGEPRLLTGHGWAPAKPPAKAADGGAESGGDDGAP